MQAFNRTLEGPNMFRNWEQCWRNVGDVDVELPIAQEDLLGMQVRHTRINACGHRLMIMPD